MPRHIPSYLKGLPGYEEGFAGNKNQFTQFSNHSDQAQPGGYYYRQLVVVNVKKKMIVETRDDSTRQLGLGCARITKRIFDLMTDGDHIAYFAHAPTELRVPMKIGGRYFAKPAKYKDQHGKTVET